MKRALERQFQDLHRGFAGDAASLASLKSRVMVQIRQQAAPVAPRASSSWFVLHNLISRPLAMGTAAFTLLASGWSATVSAAVGSLPGDTLYPIKRVTESAQLSFAPLDRRAVLHTEFAGRRLEEVAALRQNGENEESAALTRQTMDAYRSELQQAAEDVATLRTENAASAVTVAAQVQQAVDALTTVTATPADDVVPPEQIAEVQDAADRVTVSVINTAVEVHEFSATEQSQRQLQEMFLKRMASLETRKTFNLHRVDVIATRIADNEELTDFAELPTADDLKRWRFAITSAMDRVPTVMSNFAQGGARTAFRDLEEIEQQMVQAEGQLAETEITLTQLLRQAQNGELQAQAVDTPVEKKTE